MIAQFYILAQEGDFDLSRLLYLLLFLVFPLLNSLGEWIRKKWGKDAEQTAQASEEDGDVIYDVAVTDDDQLVLQPAAQVEPPQPKAPVPTVAPPAAHPPPIARPTPTARPLPGEPPARSTPQPKRPEPARAHPSAQRRPQPQRKQQADKYRAFEPTEPILEAQLVKENQLPLRNAQDLLAGESFDTGSLRKAVILAEILSPPLATRDTNTTPFARPE